MKFVRRIVVFGLACGLWSCDDDGGSPPDETAPDGGRRPGLPPRDNRPPPRADLPDPVTVVLRDGERGYRGVADTWVSNVEHTDVPETQGNFGGHEQLVVFDASVRQALLRFDLSGIPADARVESATVEVFVEALEYPMSPELVMHRVTAEWVEGTCRSQYDCPPDGATWIRRGPRLGEWSSPGGDYDDLLAAVRVPEAGSRVSLDLTPQVRRWIRGDQPNHGVLLRGRRAWSNSITLASSESPRADRRPALVVRYRPAMAPETMSGPLAPRVENRGCRLPELPGGSLRLERAWPGLGFDRPEPTTRQKARTSPPSTAAASRAAKRRAAACRPRPRGAGWPRAPAPPSSISKASADSIVAAAEFRPALRWSNGGRDRRTRAARR